MSNRSGESKAAIEAWSLIWNRLGNTYILNLKGQQQAIWKKLWCTGESVVAPDIVLVAREVLDEQSICRE